MQLPASILARAAALAHLPGRHLLGITGPPGAGKSTVSAAVVAAMDPGAAAVLPMDGFHRSNAWLAAHALTDRKGAPETFDAVAFVAAVAAVRRQPLETHRLPAFDHAAQEPEPGAVVIGPDVRLVLVEGNYLLLPDEPWSGLARLLHETWYVDAPRDVLAARLLERQRGIWGEEEAARAFVERSDLANADLVARTRGRADVLVDTSPPSGAGDPVPRLVQVRNRAG